jgi:hypothetical protein
MGDNLKVDQFDREASRLKMSDDLTFEETGLKMDDDSPKIELPPQILYTYVENKAKLNADDADQSDKTG